MPDRTAYRSAVLLAIAAAMLLFWLSVGVGIIGQDGDPANIMYFGVLAIGVAGALFARFRPLGMARALIVTALAQALVGAIALFGGLGRPYSGPAELMLLNGFFVALFIGSAWLFRRAARLCIVKKVNLTFTDSRQTAADRFQSTVIRGDAAHPSGEAFS